MVVDKEMGGTEELADAVLRGLGRIAGSASSLSRMVHGSTLALNTLLEESGARVGLITTKGFRDALALGRGNRANIYDLFWTPAVPLVPRHLRREVSERLSPLGDVIASLDRPGLEAELAVLMEYNIEALAICFLHAHVNPAHEREAVAIAQELYPELVVSSSHEITGEWREYERTSSVVVNAYVRPKLSMYFSHLEAGLERMAFQGDLAVMQSNGGIAPTEVARDVPVKTLNSGPAGGVIGGAVLANHLGIDRLVCADVGGTSFDVALIEGGVARQRHIAELNGRAVIAPGIEILSIGAGGGSVAWVDERGMLAVGPRSAGADPGPACFGRGGTELTVTDANVLLGRLAPESFLGNRLNLQPTAARDAAIRLGRSVGMSADDVAAGTLRLAETNMAYAIRQVTVERGKDPREFTLLAYGGGGGLFAGALLRELEIPNAICPPHAAVFAAYGSLFADYHEDAVEISVLPATAERLDEFLHALDRTRKRALAALERHGFRRNVAVVAAAVDARFSGQEHTLTVPLTDGNEPSVLAALIRDFKALHKAEFGHVHEDRDVEIVAFRARATAPVPHPTLEPMRRRSTVSKPVLVRRVWFFGLEAFAETPIFKREALSAGDSFAGPAVIEEWNHTVVVEPGQSVMVDEYGNLIIQRER